MAEATAPEQQTEQWEEVEQEASEAFTVPERFQGLTDLIGKRTKAEAARKAADAEIQEINDEISEEFGEDELAAFEEWKKAQVEALKSSGILQLLGVYAYGSIAEAKDTKTTGRGPNKQYKKDLETEQKDALAWLKKNAKGKAKAKSYAEVQAGADIERDNAVIQLAKMSKDGVKKDGRGRATRWYT